MLTKIIFELALVVGACGFLFPDDNRKTVSTPVGDIIGRVSDVPYNSTFSHRVQVFKGIPYAEAPAGDLRFKKPVPKAAFTTAFDARSDSFACPQYKASYMTYPMGEDCLRLNVFVPGDGSSQTNKPKPVMIYIHGGGFAIGTSYSTNAGMLSTFGDVIVVTINYRLAQFGWLSTSDSVVPGNLGHWDQHLAFQWVHDNIRAFGGDPQRVTIFGESSGSVNVVFQAFYPGNKGLFQRAIAESGSVTTPWGYKSQGRNLKDTVKFAREAGCPQVAPTDFIQCLSSKPITDLIDLVARLPFDDIPLPVFDGEFVLDTPASLLSGKSNATEAIDMFQSVDLIIGFNNADGLLDKSAWLNKINYTDSNNFTIPKSIYERRVVPSYLYYYFNASDFTDAASLEIVHAYTDWSDPYDDVKRVQAVIGLGTDASFTVTTVNTANLHVGGTRNTYVYEFFARPSFPVTSVPVFLDGPNIANHYDDISYVFGKTYRNESENPALSKYFKTTQAMLTFWTNFAKSGDPNMPEDVTRFTGTTWPAYSDHEKYLDISLDMGQQSVKSRVRPDKVDLWNKILPVLMNSTTKCN